MNIEELADEYNVEIDDLEQVERTLDIEVIEAGLQAGLMLEVLEEAYIGLFNSPVEFAEAQAEEAEPVLRWPYNCIDWEQAAQELMYSYTEVNNHYFINL